MKGFNTAIRSLCLYLMFCPAFCFANTRTAIGADRQIKNAASRCTDPNNAVVEYFKVISSATPELADAIRKFPKGADIHNHLSGTVMPENYIGMGSADGDCYGPDQNVPAMYTIRPYNGTPNVCSTGDRPLSQASPADVQKLVTSLSMYNFSYTDIQSGHDQFFATFGRFGTVSGSDANRGRMLAILLQRANTDTVSYVETMMSFQTSAVGKLADMLRLKYPDNKYYTDSQYYGQMYNYLLSAGLKDVATAAQKDISGYVNSADAILKCGTPAQDPACGVAFAFLSEINRNSAKADKTADLPKIFTQTALSFLLSSNDKRVVGINLVSGEDLPVSMDNFGTEMKFIAFFNSIYPKVNIALHAGEITPCFVGTGNPALKDHITGSLNAGAKRLGHATSFEYLTDSDQADVANLIKSKNALVEIPFTSNAQILGVAGAQHPFPLYYWQYGVPSSFSTDDEGVSHARYTDEWVYAFMQYDNFTYNDMVTLARYSEQYSFIPGDPLWTNVPAATIVNQCAGVVPGTPNPAEPCKSFLAGSPKATMQWNYEASLSRYTKEYGQLLRKYRRISGN